MLSLILRTVSMLQLEYGAIFEKRWGKEKTESHIRQMFCEENKWTRHYPISHWKGWCLPDRRENQVANNSNRLGY